MKLYKKTTHRVAAVLCNCALKRQAQGQQTQNVTAVYVIIQRDTQ